MGRVGFRIIIFEACSTFNHITACMFAEFLSEPFTPKASAVSLPPRLLRLLPAGAFLPDGVRTRWKTAPFHGAPINLD
jgi:hypothetical protein